MDDGDPIEQIAVNDFDLGTRIDVYADGTLYLKLPLMPPSWWDGVDPLDDFQDLLANAAGAKVIGEDKELFRIEAAGREAVERIRAFLVELRRGYPRAPRR